MKHHIKGKLFEQGIVFKIFQILQVKFLYLFHVAKRAILLQIRSDFIEILCSEDCLTSSKKVSFDIVRKAHCLVLSRFSIKDSRLMLWLFSFFQRNKTTKFASF